jgi:hypothetical protein
MATVTEVGALPRRRAPWRGVLPGVDPATRMASSVAPTTAASRWVRDGPRRASYGYALSLPENRGATRLRPIGTSRNRLPLGREDGSGLG